jgi:uncharacterized protein (DUF427 family)
MGLMTGTGPLGRKPVGSFNFEPPEPGLALYLEPGPKRVRVVVAGETVADSRSVLMLHESGHQPIYYFPPQDVRAELLEPSDRRTRCPKKGEASYYSIRAGDHRVENGAWCYPDPIDSALAIAGLIAFYWNRMDAWLEEDEEVFVHPRDPYHRVDVLATSRRIRVSLYGELLAATSRALALYESNLPPRWYMPREDVVRKLVPSETVARCPYKGLASYHSVVLGSGETVRDLVWTYERPLAETVRIAGRLCFLNERVDIELDGELQERPESPWSSGATPGANLPPAQTRG